ncbi:MAG TPA: insulinase family protein [Longimicrobiales bacterium]|nr:insulinase family protein [Longimicrobiales bacterium]
MRPVHSILTCAAIAAGCAGAAAAQSAETPLPPNPFATFEGVRLANGVSLWYGVLPGATVTSMAVLVPYGHDDDPRGREQTAHLLEHVLLSDRDGRSEAELVDELTRRGGTYAGITGPDYTAFPLSIQSAEAAYGIRWLHGIVAPRFLPDPLVDRNREPVRVEIAARHGRTLRGPSATFVRHPRLRPPGFWQREFGYDAHEERVVDPAAALSRVAAADVRDFFDTRYGPADMTLIIVSGRPRGDLQAVIDETFGTIPWRPAPAPRPAPDVRTTESRRFTWRPGGAGRIIVGYRLPELSARDELRLAFIGDLLRERLTRELRGGSAKTVYSVGTQTRRRGGAAWLAIEADFVPEHYPQVLAAVDRELGRLADPHADTAAFYDDREAVSRSLRLRYASPGALTAWAMERLHTPGRHTAFPDAGEYYATVGPDSIAAFAARTFVDHYRMLTVIRPFPVSILLLAALAGLILLAAGRAYRAVVFRPADMTAIRYVARIRPPRLLRIGRALVLLALVTAAVRLLIAGTHYLVDPATLAVDSFLLTVLVVAGALFVTATAGLAGAGHLRHKVLVFTHEIRFKSPTFRATVIPGSRVAGARPRGSAGDVRLRDRLPGRRKGVIVALRDGTEYLVQVRNPADFEAAVNALAARCACDGEGRPATAGADDIPGPAPSAADAAQNAPT